MDQLLCNEVTTYKGRFYELKEAVMKPRLIQKPQPPIMIAAFGLTMLKYAARYADTWSSVDNNTDASVEATHKRNELLDRYCKEIGREPYSLRRSLLEWEGAISWSGGLMSSWQLEENFREMVERFIDVGITEFHFLYPAREEQFPVFENIAREVIPELKDRFSE